MLFHIQPGDFLTRADPQPDSFIEDLKNQRHHDTRYKSATADNSRRLNDQQLTDRRRTADRRLLQKHQPAALPQRTTDSMYRNCAEQISRFWQLWSKKFYCQKRITSPAMIPITKLPEH